MNLATRILNYLPGYSAWRARRLPGGGGLDHAQIETKSEEEITTQHDNNFSIADARDYIRNNPFAQTVLLQLQINIVGEIGGRLAFATPDDDFNARVNTAWKRWTKFCGFTASESFNRLLRDIVGCEFFNGGDCLLVFDDGQLTGRRGSGKILMFESDQIANTPASWFERHYPAGWTQTRGIVRDEYGRIRGAFASSRRGIDEMEFNPDGTPAFLQFVDREAYRPPIERNWLFVARTWRPNQVRGVPALIHVLNELRNLDDLGGAETQAAKLNAHYALAIEESESASDSAAVAALMAGEQPERGKVRFDAMFRKQAQILQLPQGKKVTAFDSKRPNDRIPEYIRQLQSDIVAVFGLGREFFTLSPESSYIAHKGAMQMAWRFIHCMQSDLELVCEWAASQWFYWRRTNPAGDFSVPAAILADIDDSVEWDWPEMPEVEETKKQAAVNSALQNTTASLRKIHGPEWRKVIAQRRIEREFCAENGETYPGDRMASGGVLPTGITPESGEEGKPDGE